MNCVKMFGSGWAGSVQTPWRVHYIEGREERRIEGGREVAWTPHDLYKTDRRHWFAGNIGHNIQVLLLIDWLIDWLIISCTAASTRVATRVIFLLLEYSLISISGCKFPFPVAALLQADCSHLMEFVETWGFAISFATCQPVPSMPLRKRRLKITLVEGRDPSGPGTLTHHHPFIRHWQLVLKYFRY